MSLAERQELTWRQESPLRVQPADKSLGTNYRSGTHIHFGLVEEHELVGLECFPDILKDFKTIPNASVEARIEVAVAILAFLFCLEKCLTGLTQQLIGVHLFSLREKGDTRTG